MNLLASILFNAVVAGAAEWGRVDDTWLVMLGVASTPDPDTIFLPTGLCVSKSVDAGKTYTVLQNSSGLTWTSTAAHSVENAAVSGLAQTKYTKDGETMSDSAGLRVISQSIEAFGEHSFGAVGQRVGLDTPIGVLEQGVAVSVDGGATFSWINIPVFTAPESEVTYPARYGAFPSDDTWYVSAGSFAGSSSSSSSTSSRAITSRLTLDTRNNTMRFETEPAPAEKVRAYRGAIAKTTDGGATWTMLHIVDGEYFNAIHCSSVERCIAVSEGGGTAHVWQTENGGASWSRTFTDLDAGASLIGARFHAHDELEGWVAGGVGSSSSMEGRFWHTTDGGRSWELGGVVKDTMGTSLSLAGPARGYAGCITRFQVSTLCYLA